MPMNGGPPWKRCELAQVANANRLSVPLRYQLVSATMGGCPPPTPLLPPVPVNSRYRNSYRLMAVEAMLLL